MSKIVLMYHDVYSDSETESGFQFPTSYPYKISADKFESHVKFAFNYCKQANLPLDCVEFTFDDGGESFHRVIAPILEKYGFKGIFFISTSYIGADKFLNKEQIKDLHQRGHTIAAHSHTHPRNMTLLSEQDLLYEWNTSVSILKDIIQSPIIVASIPSGFCSEMVVNTAIKSGIRVLYTSKPTDVVSMVGDVVLVGRYVVHCNTTLNIICKIISSRMYRMCLLLKWSLISIAKSLLGSHYNQIKRCLIR